MTAPARVNSPAGVVYLVHFTEPYRHARHYTGWTLPTSIAGSPSTRQDAGRDCCR
jgi:hypothetical protein